MSEKQVRFVDIHEILERFSGVVVRLQGKAPPWFDMAYEDLIGKLTQSAQRHGPFGNVIIYETEADLHHILLGILSSIPVVKVWAGLVDKPMTTDKLAFMIATRLKTHSGLLLSPDTEDKEDD